LVFCGSHSDVHLSLGAFLAVAFEALFSFTLTFGTEGFVAAIGSVILSFGWFAVAASGLVHLSLVHVSIATSAAISFLISIATFFAAIWSTTISFHLAILIHTIDILTILNSAVLIFPWWLLLSLVLSLVTGVLETGVSAWHTFLGALSLSFTSHSLVDLRTFKFNVGNVHFRSINFEGWGAAV